MAQLRDLIVNGATRLIGDVFTNKIQITAISAPTASNSTTYGPGTSGQILKSNGTNVYWAADNNAGGTVTSITLKAGNGVSLDTDNTAITTSGTRTISHADTSSQASITASGRKYITGVTLDSYGHVTGLTTGTETVTDTHHTAYLRAGASGGTANAATTTGNTYLNLVENSTNRSGVKLVPGSNMAITSDANGNVTFAATNTTYSAGTGLSLSGTTFNVYNVPEAELTWGGKNFSSSYGPIDAAMIEPLGANRFAFLKAAGLTIEYSTDGGSNWTDYGATDVQKTGLFGVGQAFVLGKHSTAGTNTINDQLRVTIATSAAGIYTVLNKIAIYMSTSGNTVQVKIEKALENAPTSFSTHLDWTGISGWSGWNILNISGITTYGNAAASQYGRIRFVFRQTAVNTNYASANISRIMGFGGVGWAIPSNMARDGHLYSYDNAQNATFPAQVTATAFNGNATSATKLATARSLKTKLDSTTAITFDGNADQNAIPITGTLGAANGGTGKTNLKDAANALINALDTGSSNLTANDYVITQYVGGGSTTTTYHRRPASALRVGGVLVTSTDEGIARYNGTTGALQNTSQITINDNGLLTATHTNGKTDGIAIKYGSTIDYFLGVGTANVNHGLYDNKAGKWVLSAGADNIWSLAGNAATATSAGSATSATKATQDGNGNVISSTYLKLSGGTMTGGVTFIGNQTSAYNDKGIIFTKGSRIGENTNGGVGVYGVERVYIRPGCDGSSSSDGIEITTSGVIPSNNNTETLGDSSHIWSNVYATTFTGALSGNATSATKATKDGDNNTISSTYLKLAGGQMTGAIGFGATGMNRAILQYDSAYPNYGIWYNDSGTDTMRFSASGNANTDAGADLCINGNGAGTVTIRGNTILHAGNYSTTCDTRYVKKAGDTMTGNLILQQASMPSVAVTETNNSTTVYLHSSSGNHGIYSNGYYNGSSFTSSGAWIIYRSTDGQTHSTLKIYGAVWNDYAEYRKDNPNENQEPGRCIKELGDGSLALTTKRLERGCEIISDTFGFAIGQDTKNGYNTPIASNGRVLAYPYESIEEFANHIGWPVCSGPNGTVSIMTEEEEEKYPSRIIGTISEIPTYKTWGTGNVEVDGRIWIRIR